MAWLKRFFFFCSQDFLIPFVIVLIVAGVFGVVGLIVYLSQPFYYISSSAEKHEAAYDLGALYSKPYKPNIILSSGDTLDQLKTDRKLIIMYLYNSKRDLRLYIEVNSDHGNEFYNIWLSRVIIKEKNDKVTDINIRNDPACEVKKSMCQQYVRIAEEAFEYYENKILAPALDDQAAHLGEL